MKKSLVAVLCLVACYSSNAQSKVFKQVAGEISSTMKVITQDDALVGYLLFTQLEKASEDSFNYRITIMDENLNEIGKVNFKQESLSLKAVSFDKDVLCLAYIKSNVIGHHFKSIRLLRKATEKGRNTVFTQFLNLDGKIFKTDSRSVDIGQDNAITLGFDGNAEGDLKNEIQLKNVPQKGFTCFFGDDRKRSLIMYDHSGEEVWEKSIAAAKDFALLASTDDVYLLTKNSDHTSEGRFVLLGFKNKDGQMHNKFPLEDKQGNQLKVLAFQNDITTGKPYISGNIINPKKLNKFVSMKEATKAYSGVFTINFNGSQKKDIKEVYSYWNDGSMSPTISTKGVYAQNHGYAKFYDCIKDYNGNTYFIGSSVAKKPRWGLITSSVILSPLIAVSPLLLYSYGTHKYQLEDAMLIKQNTNGALTFENEIESKNSGYSHPRYPIAFMERKKFYTVSNATTKSNYLIVDDVKDITIYNIDKKKVIRKVSHKDGNSTINIFPAKEGHVMVSEYN
ncbi:MAG TPA: DUF6770 family protein, partial [Segetibacter sp.]